MTTTTADTAVFRIYIKAPIEKVWAYIVDPELNGTYAYGTQSFYDLVPGGTFTCPSSPAMKEFGSPDVMCDGEVIQSDAPKLLVQTWANYFTPETVAEGARTLTWELEEEEGVTRVTVTHDVTNAPATRVFITGAGEGGAGGGWPWILSDLKTILETGNPFQG